MTSSFTTIGKGFGAPCQPATERAWIQARQDPRLAALCQQIANCQDPDQQKKLKERLPVWTPRCSEFKDDHRAEKNVLKPLNRQMFDIDDKGHTDEILAKMVPKEDGEMYIGPFLVLMVEESVRHGTHVLVVPPDGLSLGDAQALFSQLIGLPVDPSVKNPAGCIFLVPEDYVKYQSKKFFEAEVTNSESADGYEIELTLQAPKPTKAQPTASSPPSRAENPTSYPDDYDGIPYPLLVDSLASQLGGAPVHGSRNSFIFSMACHLRYVCNDDPQWIAKVLPTYGEDQSRVLKTIQSACNRAQSREMPNMLQRAIGVARGQFNMLTMDSATANPMSAASPPPLPKKLPRLIQLLVSKVDPMYQPAVALSVFPALGAHLHGTTAKYIDNTENDLGGCMSVLMAKQSIGKGAVNKPLELIMADIKEHDQYSRTEEAAWKVNTDKNGKHGKRPTDLCVQYLKSNMTNAALVQRLMDVEKAGGRFLYVKLDEIELLNQIQASGGAKVSEMIRLAFTQSLYGQERVGTDSVTGTPPLRFNFNASTTVPAGQAFFRNGLTNGTLSRISFATIIKPIGKRGIPKFGEYDDTFRKTLQPYIVNLNAATGMIDCKQARKMAEEICDANEELSELSDDEVFETLSYRACRMAFDKAMILYIAHGYQWTREIAEFCKWSASYDMWVKLHYFGQSMREKIQVESLQPCSGPRNLLDLLPDRFNKQDLIAIHRAQGKGGNVQQLLYTWVSRKYIELDQATQEYVKTPLYLSKHKRNMS